MVRRETFIALRARRQAHRIASNVLYPADRASSHDASPLLPAERWAEAQTQLSKRMAEESLAAMQQRQETILVASIFTLFGIAIGTAVALAFGIP